MSSRHDTREGAAGTVRYVSAALVAVVSLGLASCAAGGKGVPLTREAGAPSVVATGAQPDRAVGERASPTTRTSFGVGDTQRLGTQTLGGVSVRLVSAETTARGFSESFSRGPDLAAEGSEYLVATLVIKNLRKERAVVAEQGSALIMVDAQGREVPGSSGSTEELAGASFRGETTDLFKGGSVRVTRTYLVAKGEPLTLIALPLGVRGPAAVFRVR
jgi:hypothetical protein